MSNCSRAEQPSRVRTRCLNALQRNKGPECTDSRRREGSRKRSLVLADSMQVLFSGDGFFYKEKSLYFEPLLYAQNIKFQVSRLQL